MAKSLTKFNNECVCMLDYRAKLLSELKECFSIRRLQNSNYSLTVDDVELAFQMYRITGSG